MQEEKYLWTIRRATEHFTIMAILWFQQDFGTTNHSVSLRYAKQKSCAGEQDLLFFLWLFVRKTPPKPKTHHPTPQKNLNALPLVRLGYNENRFLIYQSIVQQAKRGRIWRAASSNDVSKKALSADSPRLTQSPPYSTAPREAYKH